MMYGPKPSVDDVTTVQRARDRGHIEGVGTDALQEAAVPAQHLTDRVVSDLGELIVGPHQRQ